MAKGASSKCLILLVLSVSALWSSGTLVGFSYDARVSSATSPAKGLSFLTENKISPSQIRVLVTEQTVLDSLSNTGVSVDLFLSETQANSLIDPKHSATSWLKTHLIASLEHVNIKSIVLSSSAHVSGSHDLSGLLATLEIIHSHLTNLGVDKKVKASVAFSLSFLERLGSIKHQQKDLSQVIEFVKKVGSFVIIEADVPGVLSMGDSFVHSAIRISNHATSLLPHSGVPMVLILKNSALTTVTEAAEFLEKTSKALRSNTKNTERLSGMYAELSPLDEFEKSELKREEEHMFHFSHRELLNQLHYKVISHDVIGPPAMLLPVAPFTIPPASPMPTVVTVPSSNPASMMPGNPAATTPSTATLPPAASVPPVATMPPATTVPPPAPVTPAAPMPPATPSLPTNPGTAYPAPAAGGIPATTPPVTNPVTPAMPTSPPATGSGQSWCVAKSGAPQSTLQGALDYACGHADCSPIQQGGNCYNPASLQNHASFAFNSYYQKNPAPTSCDFGGAATLVSTNPSSGSCIYQASSSSSSVPPSITTPTPPSSSTQPPPSPLTKSPPSTSIPGTTPSVLGPPPGSPGSPGLPASLGIPGTGSGSSPMVLNNSSPGSASFGTESPPPLYSESVAADKRPLVGYTVLVASVILGEIVLGM